MKNIIILPLLFLIAACGGALSATDNSSQSISPIVGTAVASCGKLTQANTTYTLVNDVTSEGTCFVIAAKNVTLDLNGHTITYDNLAPVTVPNGSFELDLTDNWDITNAPNASRSIGQYVGATVSKYDGDYTLRFSLPFAGAQYVRSQQVTLAANTTYSISAMFRNSGNNDAVNPYTGGVRDSLTMKIELEGRYSSSIKNGVTWRGFEFTNFTYTTGASPENHIIRITVDNVSAAAIGYVYVDDIKILKTPSYGVQVGVLPSIWGNGAVVKNGTIVQGQGNGFASHAIYVAAINYADGGFNFNNLTLTTQGVNSKIIAGLFAYDSLIHHNVINHNVITVKSRDNLDGAAIHFPYATNSYNTRIYNNTFNTGPQTAISLAHQVGAVLNEVSHNAITLQSRYTNDFAIGASGALVHNNTINCGSGSNACRGIWIGGTGTKVYDNIVTVQALRTNQEYNGCEAGGTYAMQAEYEASGVEVYGNTVTAITGSGVCEAAALRLNSAYDGSATINIHDNIFTATNTGSAPAYAMKFANIYGSGYQINNNTFITNGHWMYLDYDQNPTKLMSATLTGNKFYTIGKLPNPFYPFLVGRGVHGAFTFVNNLYGTGDQARFRSEVFRTPNGTIDAFSSITVVP